MTKLLVEEIISTEELYSNFTWNLNQRLQIAAFYPYIFMKNIPAGDFYMGIRKVDGFSYEQHFTSLDIQALLNTTDDNAHLFLPVIPEYPIFLEKGSYQIFLYAENYSFNRNSFLGWVRQHENLNNQLNYSPSNDAENPLSFRLKAYKEGVS